MIAATSARKRISKSRAEVLRAVASGRGFWGHRTCVFGQRLWDAARQLCAEGLAQMSQINDPAPLSDYRYIVYGMDERFDRDSLTVVKVKPASNVLRDATIALHDELANLELDIENEVAAIQKTKSTRRYVSAPHLVRRWQSQHDKLALFFDLDVYLDRDPAPLLFESPHCVGHSKLPVPA